MVIDQRVFIDGPKDVSTRDVIADLVCREIEIEVEGDVVKEGK